VSSSGPLNASARDRTLPTDSATCYLFPTAKHINYPSRSLQFTRPPATTTCGHACVLNNRSFTASSVYAFGDRFAVSTRASLPFPP